MKYSILFLLLAGISCAQQPSAGMQEITIESIFAEGAFGGAMPETIQWSPDGSRVSYMLRDEQSGSAQLYSVDPATGKPAVLVAPQKLAALAPPVTAIKDERERERRTRYSVAGYHWAPDSKHILFDANGQLWLYDLDSGTAIALSAAGDAAGDPKFSPDGKRLAYVRKHNLHLRQVAAGKESTLTSDKDENILNGEVDWVYAEELGVRSNYFWSPDGSKIAFLQMNETRVPAYPITDFLPQHPAVSQEKYPKAGDPNPEVRIGILHSNGGGTRWLHLSDEKDIYIPRFGWLNDAVAWALVLNRAQTQLDLYFADINTGKSRRVLTETSDAWIDIDDNFKILNSGGRFIWSSWRDGHTHLYLYSFDKNDPLAAEAKLQNQITKGDFEVFDLESLDENSGTVYFIANPDDDRQRRLCSVKLDGGDFTMLTPQPGTHETIFAPDAKNFVDTFSTLLTPPALSLCKVGESCKTFWQSRSIAAYDLIPPQWLDFKADDGTVLHGLLYLPPGRQSTKIPLILNPYGGPHAQFVADQWSVGNNLLFNQVLMKDGIAVLQVDNRGMAGRGKKFTAALLHKFGEVELKDQLAALDQALSRFPQLDGSRLGIWGWSYGGFMTLTALTHSDRFKAGISVAPVTDWHDYDSIYTERYEGLLPASEAVYKKSSPVNFAGNLHGDLLEVHGTVDDNVHMQNTIQMIHKLISAQKQFSLLLYPDKTHSIAGPVARVHLFTRIREFFGRELLQGKAQ